jgi:hypothetical protein
MASQVPSILETDGDEDISEAPIMLARSWWRQAAMYVGAGIRICRKDIPGLVTIVGLFMLPPLAAVVVGSQPGDLAHWIAEALPWITIVMGNMSAVLAVEAIDAGKPIIPSEILPAAVRWLPRYLWANGITTAIFWVPVTLGEWAVGKLTDFWGWPSFTVILILGIPMLFLHVRLFLPRMPPSSMISRACVPCASASALLRAVGAWLLPPSSVRCWSKGRSSGQSICSFKASQTPMSRAASPGC